MTMTVTWFGHATILLVVGGMRLLVDPFEVTEALPKAVDALLFTHSHYDHFAPNDYAFYKAQGIVAEIGPKDLADKLSKNAHLLEPWGEVKLKAKDGEITVKAIPSYNINKKFHPKANGWLGFLISYQGKTIYIAGDTDLIPEMDKITCDVAFLPIGGTYTMTAEEAARAANTIKTKVAVPIHWGKIVGTASDAALFMQQVGTKGHMLVKGQAEQF